MKNTLPVTSKGRAPRGILKANGTVIPVRDFRVESNAFFEADTFSANLAVSALPTGFGPQWWSNTEPITIEIFAGFPTDPENFTAADLDSLFVGQVDVVDYNLVGTVINVSGRDLTGKFQDTKSDAKYPNLTSSQIVTKLAQEQGLTPVVTATHTRVGTYYEVDHVTLQDNRTEWDLLIYLAKQEGFVVFTKGQELHFEPPPPVSQDPYVFQWVPPSNAGSPPQANFTGLALNRSLTLAKDILVIVRSWNARQKKAFVRKETVQHKSNAKGVQTYVYSIPGLTAEQAQQRAKTIAHQLALHERKATVEGPADNVLERTDVVQIKGTGTSWDQTYFVDSLTREFSFDEGYRWTVGIKNHSPESESSL